jgi:hypothetical protein
MEQWNYIPGFERGYKVSTAGHVFSVKRGRLLSQWLKTTSLKRRNYTSRYYMVELSHRGVSRSYLVHVLVLLAFRGPRPPGHECRHLDGDPKNNNLSNLEWGTRRVNTGDRLRHGKALKLTPDLVRYIRRSPATVRELANELGCGKSTVHYARTKHFWADVV